ncbi:creatinine amidohydrolase [Humibacillus xanthopallidus]|uniref:Creatinine amidohydrolase n=1 Tax=Humibacillus xanthopallidus TaxID=412689 RepID=A0A543PM30_9MICO|nr:creatininase [Humibacillus xanthopallidus]TQN45126.1 creatinine amidohydrolase [Humibacillus xanthopallidus]
MPTTVLMEELDAFTYRDLVGSGAPVIVPVGAIEQHGPHLPLSTDVVLAKAMSRRLAESVGGIVAAPVTYGYKSQQRSGGGNHLGGTTSLDAATVIAIARTLTLELARHGATKVVFLNGHFENYQFLYEGVEQATAQLSQRGEDVSAILLSYWDFVDEATIEEIYRGTFPGWDVEHGGVLETSLMLHLHPELVHLDRVMDLPAAQLPRFDRLPVRPELTPASGCLSSAASASEEAGRLLLDRTSAALTAALGPELAVRPQTPAETLAQTPAFATA